MYQVGHYLRLYSRYSKEATVWTTEQSKLDPGQEQGIFSFNLYTEFLVTYWQGTAF